MYVYIYTYVYVCVCVCVLMYANSYSELSVTTTNELTNSFIRLTCGRLHAFFIFSPLTHIIADLYMWCAAKNVLEAIQPTLFIVYDVGFMN